MPGQRVDEQQAIAEEFALFGDWTERYQYLIELGRKLPDFPAAWRTDANRLHGCQSMVWVVAAGDAGKIVIHATSDSTIVSGLIALVLRVYSGRDARTILATPPDFIQAIGLGGHLSPTRSNGLAALLAKVRDFAARALAGERFTAN
jgi:cysteine desulfuration protein SufE